MANFFFGVLLIGFPAALILWFLYLFVGALIESRDDD